MSNVETDTLKKIWHEIEYHWECAGIHVEAIWKTSRVKLEAVLYILASPFYH